MANEIKMSCIKECDKTDSMNNANHIILSILSKDLFLEEISIMKEIPKLNKLANYLLEVSDYKYSRESANESANNTKKKTEFVYQEKKDDFADFINASLRKQKILR